LFSIQGGKKMIEFSTIEMYFHANSCGVTDKDISRILNIEQNNIYELKKNGTTNMELAYCAV
jgi:hypothetical protein